MKIKKGKRILSGFFLLKSALIAALILFTIFEPGYCASAAESLDTPQIFRGKILMHFPLGAFPADSAGGSYIWLPIPEMGFTFCPTIKFKQGGGWWEFPIHIMTFFPFLEKYAALGDVSFGAGLQAPPLYHFGISYRFIQGKFYPLNADFHAHIVQSNLALPIIGFSGAGVKIEWLVSSRFDMDTPYTTDEINYDHYEGSVIAIAPYWKFPLKYGQISIAYRVVVSTSLTGTETQKQNTYSLETRTVSAFEIGYTYP